ncbi:hypothetical protein FOXB_01696 [Fusarium oxysporum f. sp. conglutinans Fo5176]|uniref:Uncharacterized protein n=1 Tax=Fusarium oxysporum (strain Fo5176) TaxID=660025 RepID=F9F5M1_FUSOF|nr:hypothetical protein FOXB_01696 [Fusarium oxysporum f. sp. conglutinans Fo5176]
MSARSHIDSCNDLLTQPSSAMPKARPSSLTGVVARGDVAPESQSYGQEPSGEVTLSITEESPNVDADLSTADNLEEEYFRESGALELVTGCEKQLALSAYISGTSRNIARFQERILAIVSELINYPRQLPFPNYKQLPRDRRAMSTAFYTIFNTSSASSITKLLLPTVPTQVQDLLGKSAGKSKITPMILLSGEEQASSFAVENM